MFGFTHLLRFNFMPRIKDLSDSKSFTIDRAIYSPFRKRKQFRLKLTLYNLNLIAMSR
ncbi:hypothetical protein D7V71_07780 [Bacillus thuringiensis]|nr:Tn3 family transposase [Bacillus thuringiensis]RKI26419.1 hypothetical protein D7V71_07780 [Bacillus thuringiensis]